MNSIADLCQLPGSVTCSDDQLQFNQSESQSELYLHTTVQGLNQRQLFVEKCLLLLVLLGMLGLLLLQLCYWGVLLQMEMVRRESADWLRWVVRDASTNSMLSVSRITWLDMEFWRGEDGVVVSGHEEDLNVLRLKFLVATQKIVICHSESFHRYGAGAATPTKRVLDIMVIPLKLVCGSKFGTKYQLLCSTKGFGMFATRYKYSSQRTYRSGASSSHSPRCIFSRKSP